MNEWLTVGRHYLLTKYGRNWRSREELLQWQERQVRRHLRRILPKSAFYRDLAGGLPAERWRELPVIDKRTMMGGFDALNTAGIRKEQAFATAFAAEESRDFSPTLGGITVGLSSGTSGHRGLFLVSPGERMAWAGTMLAKALPGTLLSRQRIAFFLRANSNLYGSVDRGAIRFAYFDLLDPLERHLDRLNEYRPTLLVGPPSMLRMLADAALRGELRIRPDKVISVAEALDPLDERYIARGFGQPVHQVYQCTEGFLGATCRYGTLHLNEDLVVVEKEWLDEDERKFVPIITDFCRTTQPIIRYRLDDILTERSEPCPCGSPMTALGSIEGRCDDMFYFPSAAAGSLRPVFPDFIRRAILSVSADIEEYAAVQHSPQLVDVSLKLPEPQREPCCEQIRRKLAELCAGMSCLPPEVRFTEWDEAQRRPGARKLRRIERKFQL